MIFRATGLFVCFFYLSSCNGLKARDDSASISESPEIILAMSGLGSLEFFGGLARSRDGGLTWTYIRHEDLGLHVEQGAFSGVQPTGLYRDADEGFLALSSYGGLAVSNDDGISWLSFEYPQEPFLDHHIYDVAYSKGSLYVGTRNGLFITRDLGVHWSHNASIDGRFKNSMISDIKIFGDEIYLATSTGVYKSVDEGATWTLILNSHNSLGYQWYYSLSKKKETLLVGTTRGRLWISKDNGQTWTPQGRGEREFPDIDDIVFDVEISDSMDFFVGIQNGGLAISRDQGVTWSLCNKDSSGFLKTDNVTSIEVKKDMVLIGTSGQGIGISYDQGWSWNVIDRSKGLESAFIYDVHIGN